VTRQTSSQFNEVLLSGYLDGELTQAEAQRVRIQVENDPETRALLTELRSLRQVTITTQFPVPTDDQWDERPRGGASRLSRYLGWGIIAIWVIAFSVVALWSLALADGNWGPKLILFGGVAGFGLLMLSVTFDRLRTYKTDRYRRVRK
jgi:anti-sigma factor RsiW